VENACSTPSHTTVTFKMQSGRQTKRTTGDPAVPEKGKDLATGRTRILEHSTNLSFFTFLISRSLKNSLNFKDFLFIFPITLSFLSLSFEKSSPFLKPSRTDKKNYLMRVGKRSAEVDLEGNERPDHGFLIRIGRSQQIPRQSLYSRKRADKTYLIRVGRSVGPPTNLIRVGRSVGPPTNLKRVGRSVGPPTNQDKRQKSGSNAFFLTRVGRAAFKRKSFFTRVGRS